ncbi:hypothetical protein Rsub_11951 [Raphidocelis subcapitata]|uniref:BBSome-interacting protein 1 n=1 Tax=Raphidocelis subcapitata TaxID=307507 RepID=A0A2V0PPV8_9CHLO|nr:hypothetical protein Rsub_11951 [Raphidocelis subcapitata]|eukprot:GBF99517.1 hypothetical protein Rsub_11951 [Raphidocelis subcapitata]
MASPQRPPPGAGAAIAEVLPRTALVVSEKGGLSEVLCKPRIMPLKSVTLIKLEEMEAKAAQVAAAQQQQGRPRTGAPAGF